MILDEKILIERLKREDKLAFKEVVTNWQSLVYNIVLSIIQNAEDAEEVTQDVFIRVYETINDFRGDSKLSTWLYRIAVTKAVDHLRKKKRKKRFAFIQSLFGKGNDLVTDPPDFFHPGAKMESRQNAAALFKAVAALPRNQKVAFVLNKVEGLNYQEISGVMKLSVSAVDSLLQRAKTNLRKYLTNYYSQDL